jgi:hypothetical protein
MGIDGEPILSRKEFYSMILREYQGIILFSVLSTLYSDTRG